MLGATVTASTIVLMAFMAGFGFGALILGNKLPKVTKPNKFLATLVFAIGTVSLFNYLIFENLLTSIYGLFQNHVVADIILFSISFILLTIPAFFMGGVIPTVSKLVISDNTNFEKKIGTIYALETFGSTLGGLLTGFILLGSVGQNMSVYIAFLINIFLSILIFSNKKWTFSKTNEQKKSKTELSDANSAKLARISTFLFGFSIIGMQVIWIRIFKTYFTNTSYTFALITSLSILGLSIGSFYFRKKGIKFHNSIKTMLNLIKILVILFVFGLFILKFLPEIFLFPFPEAGSNPFFRLIIIPVLASLFIVFPPAIISGIAFPLACKMNTQSTEKVGKHVSQILMFNTFGSVVGPAIVAFLLIPFLGSANSVILLNILIVLFILFSPKILKLKIKEDKIQKFFFPALLVFMLFSFVIPFKFIPPSVKKQDKEILVYSETVEGTITVVDEKNKGIFGKSTFVNNSSVIGSSYDAIKVVKMIGHIPFFAGLECKNALVIGFGIGVTTSAIASHSDVENIDCVELVPGLVKYARYYSDFNQGVYNDKRLNMISGDGRHYLKITNKKYDLISCDPTHPVLGSGGLYTKEYFEQCYAHLNEGGMISQYLPLHKLSKEDLLGIIGTFNSVFENSSIWLGQYHAILFGIKDDRKIDFEIWKQRVLEMPKDDFFYFDPYHIAANLILDSDKIKEITKDYPINSDYLNYTEFFSFDNFSESNIYDNLKFLSENRIEISNVFTNIDDFFVMDSYIDGNKKLVESLYFLLKGEQLNSKNSLEEAVSLNPQDYEYPFLLKFYFGE